MTLVFLIGILSIGVNAAAPVFSISGPGTLRAGDNIKVSVNVNGSGLLAAMGKVTYDASILTYNSTSDNLSGWAIDIEQSSGNITFLAIDDKMAAPINSNKVLFSINFTVKTSVSAGDKVTITASNLEASDGTNDFNPANATYQRDVAPPLSSNNNLKTLNVQNATISPSFAATTTSYTATVPFSVSRLELSAQSEDNKAKVAISGQSLSVGRNTVTVTVTAENGSQKNYTIAVTREQDPDYQASNNGKLKSLVPGVGILSPVFNTDTRIYSVYLPNEIEKFNASGEVQDSKATGVESQEIALNVGENEFIIYGIAEDGTKEEYKIIVVRMPKRGEEMPDSTPTPEPVKETTPAETFTLEGRILDEDGNPLANKIVELHSEPITTRTDTDGNYRFENVTSGEHTLFVKEEDGTEIATMPLKVTFDNTTGSNGGEIIVEGNTTLDLKLTQDGIKIQNIAKFTNNPTTPVNETKAGIPWWGVLLIAIASAGVGFMIRHFTYMKKNQDTEQGNIVM